MKISLYYRILPGGLRCLLGRFARWVDAKTKTTYPVNHHSGVTIHRDKRTHRPAFYEFRVPIVWSPLDHEDRIQPWWKIRQGMEDNAANLTALALEQFTASQAWQEGLAEGQRRRR